MDEKSLIALAVLLSLAGLGLILYASPRIEPPYVSIQDILPAHVGLVVATSGTLIRDSENAGVRILTLYDNATIVVPLFGMAADAEMGDIISLAGAVKLYKGALEIMPAMGRIAVKKPKPLPVKIADIGPKLMYKVVSVSGTAREVRPVAEGYLFDIDDGSGKIRVAAFGKEIGLRENSFAGVEGMVTTYRNEIELLYRSSIS